MLCMCLESVMNRPLKIMIQDFATTDILKQPQLYGSGACQGWVLLCSVVGSSNGFLFFKDVGQKSPTNLYVTLFHVNQLESLEMN